MNAALLAAAVVLAAGVALRPAPVARRPGPGANATSRPGPARLSTRRRRPHRRRSPGDPTELAAWCDALARAVRGGKTVRGAIAAVPPPASALPTMEPVMHALERGASLADALAGAATAQRRAPPHLDLVLVVLRACAQHGGAAGEPIDRCAAALRQRAAVLAERDAQSAQARLSATVMTLLPVVLLAVLVLTSGPVRAAVVTPVGALVVTFGGALNAVGWAWMRRLIRGGARWR